MLNKSKNIRSNIIGNLYKGNLIVDSKMASINKAQKIYDASSSTIKNAYNWLVSIGVLYKKQGIGYFVAKNWSKKIISSPSLDKSTSETEVIEIEDCYSNFFNWEKEKDIIKNRMKVAKFYYQNKKLKKYNVMLINSKYAGNPSLNVFKSSFISHLYSKKIHPQSEKINIKARPANEKESKILEIKKGETIITMHMFLFDKNNNEICRNMWFYNAKSFNFHVHKNNY